MEKKTTFSHVPNFTDYMKVSVQLVDNFFENDLNQKVILDIPAGNGLLSKELRRLGGNVVSGDINNEDPSYSYVDMEEPFPFKNEQFDAVICLEGIEHTMHPEILFSELSRVLKSGGLLIISTPNIQCFYSRFQFLCTGYLFQFDPFDNSPLKPNISGDKGHISPVSYSQLRYYSELHNLKTLSPSGGRLKRVLFAPLFLPFVLIGLWWSIRDWKRTSNDSNSFEIIRHLFNIRLLFSRSLIFKAIKNL